MTTVLTTFLREYSTLCHEHGDDHAHGCRNCDAVVAAKRWWIKLERALGKEISPASRYSLVLMLFRLQFETVSEAENRGRGRPPDDPRQDDKFLTLALILNGSRSQRPILKVRNGQSAARVGVTAAMKLIYEKFPQHLKRTKGVENFLRRARNVVNGTRGRRKPHQTILLQNISGVCLQHAAPGGFVQISCNDGVPVELFWRKRLAEKACKIARS